MARYLKVLTRTARCGHKQTEYISYNRVSERIYEENRIMNSQKFCHNCERNILEQIAKEY